MFYLVFNKLLFSVTLGALLEYYIYVLGVFLRLLLMQSCLKTPRLVSAAPSTISRLPSGSFTPVSTSVSVPVIASDSALTSSSGSGFSSVPLSAVQPESITTEPLLSGGQSDRDLYSKVHIF